MDATEALAKIKSQVENILKLSLPKSEAETRFKKLEDDTAKILKALEGEAIRKTTLEIGGGNFGGAGTWLGKEGFGGVRDIKSVSIYRLDSRGQTQDSLIVPETVRDALKTMDEVFLADFLLTHTKGEGYGRDWLEQKQVKGERKAFLDRCPSLGKKHDQVMKGLAAFHGKALDTTTAGGVSEWIPTTFSTNLLDEVRLAMPFTNLIPHMNQPANPWVNPLLTGVGKAYRKVELANITESALTSGNRTWNAHVFAVYQAFSDEVSEDSIVAIVPTMRAAIIRAMGEGLEEAMVNGDPVAASHIDVDYQWSSGAYSTYQGGIGGIRHFALDAAGTGTANTVDGGGNALSYVDVGSALATMSKFGANRIATGEVVGACTAQRWIQLLTEASSPVQTVDKYGARATILTGELGRIFGVPMFVSHGVEQRKDSVSATGLNAATGNTLSTALVFNRTNWTVGDRRDFRLERDKDIIAGRNDVVATARWSMSAKEGDITDANWDPSGTPAACAIINVD